MKLCTCGASGLEHAPVAPDFTTERVVPVSVGRPVGNSKAQTGDPCKTADQVRVPIVLMDLQVICHAVDLTFAHACVRFHGRSVNFMLVQFGDVGLLLSRVCAHRNRRGCVPMRAQRWEPMRVHYVTDGPSSLQ